MSLDPSTIGRYKVLGTLGAGAMGTVYLAEDPLLKRTLAIKVVREGTGDAAVLERFKREAEISARLNHPNAITVFDVGDEPDLGPYLVMEYVEGESLATLLRRGPLDATTAAELLLQAAGAVEAVHGLGVLHRDIKPENFMVTKDGRLKLMDFGIARGEHGRLTSTAAFLGTPAYASPEVLGGAKATPAADRWAFSLTAYEMLTGSLPFAGESVGAILYRIVHDPPVFDTGLAPEVVDIFKRAFEKEPSTRFPDLRSFLHALLMALPLDETVRQAFLAQLSIQVRTTGVYHLESTRWRPSRGFLWAVGGLLVVGLALWALLARPESGRVLSIDSRPTGAEVFIDGASLGKTPLHEVMVKGRPEQLRLEKQDFLPLEHRLEKGERYLYLRMAQAPFEVRVVTEPQGAEVLLDGTSQGLTPTSLTVPGTGVHGLRLTLEGHQPWTATLDRHTPLPEPIPLQKVKTKKKLEEEGKFKKFIKGIFQEKK